MLQFVKDNVNTALYGEVAGRFVKSDYEPEDKKHEESLDLFLSLWLKKRIRCLK
jgi:isoleucyl-tRNA synthetase